MRNGRRSDAKLYQTAFNSRPDTGIYLMNWQEFVDDAPELAEYAQRLIEQSGFVFIGTIRKDGSPRISPVEALIVDGNLYLGMMWESFKAHDLLRDPRCTIHSSIKDRMASEGEFKLHGQAVEVKDGTERRQYCDALYQKIGWNPSDSKFHLFRVEIESAGLFLTNKNERIFKRFRRAEGIKEFRQDVEGHKEAIE